MANISAANMEDGPHTTRWLSVVRRELRKRTATLQVSGLLSDPLKAEQSAHVSTVPHHLTSLVSKIVDNHQAWRIEACATTSVSDAALARVGSRP